MSKYLKPRWVFLLLALLLCLMILPSYGFLREDLQTVLFPLMLIVLLKLPNSTSLRPPRAVIVLALTFWMLGALHVRAYAPSLINGHGVYLSRVNSAGESPEDRELYRRLNEIARLNDLPSTYLVQQHFSSDDEARSWLESHDEALFVATGSSEWVRVIMDPERIIPFSTKPDLPEFFTKAAKRAGLPRVDALPIVRTPWLEEPFVLGTVPEYLQVPGRPPELGQHFLAWFAEGLQRDPQLKEQLSEPVAESEMTEQLRGMKKAALFAAAGIEGKWLTSTPLGVPLSLAATHELLSAFDLPGILQEKALHCAQVSFNHSAAVARDDDVPHIAAIAFNNIAVARIYAGYRDSDFARAHHWLSAAAGMHNRDGSPVLGAKLALVNLEMLWRSGLITPHMLHNTAY
ncbi:MAG: hypothetical protein KDD66_12490 [Bdellovibrionales bacterium]|nr:hypothetical protein [Bdellovibrionales bacterium]